MMRAAAAQVSQLSAASGCGDGLVVRLEPHSLGVLHDQGGGRSGRVGRVMRRLRLKEMIEFVSEIYSRKHAQLEEASEKQD